MIVALDHIAIAVPDLEKAIKRFMEDFELTYKGSEDVADAKTSTAFFPVPETSIELVHPLNGEGPIAGYLEKKGGGLHHLCIVVLRDWQFMDHRRYRRCCAGGYCSICRVVH